MPVPSGGVRGGTPSDYEDTLIRAAEDLAQLSRPSSMASALVENKSDTAVIEGLAPSSNSRPPLPPLKRKRDVGEGTNLRAEGLSASAEKRVASNNDDSVARDQLVFSPAETAKAGTALEDLLSAGPTDPRPISVAAFRSASPNSINIASALSLLSRLDCRATGEQSPPHLTTQPDTISVVSQSSSDTTSEEAEESGSESSPVSACSDLGMMLGHSIPVMVVGRKGSEGSESSSDLSVEHIPSI